MRTPEITFVPIVNLVDAGRLSQDADGLHNFMKNLVGEAEILSVNKVELIILKSFRKPACSGVN